MFYVSKRSDEHSSDEHSSRFWDYHSKCLQGTKELGNNRVVRFWSSRYIPLSSEYTVKDCKERNPSVDHPCLREGFVQAIWKV